MLSGFLGADQNQDPLPELNNHTWKDALGLVGLGLLSKGMNRDADLTPLIMRFPEIQKENQQKALLQKMAQDFSQHPAIKDPQTSAIIRDLIMSGMPDKALDLLKQPVSTFSSPISVTDPATGKQKYVQVDKQGQVRDVQGILPNERNTYGYSPDERQRRLDISSWATVPTNERASLLAQAAGMGFDYNEANKHFQQGKTLADLAKIKGLDPSALPPPIYPTTTGSLTQIQKRQQALAEMDSLGKTIADWTAPYARRWQGYSIPAIIDAARGENTDQVAKFLAARGAALDQAAIRVRALGGQIGEAVLQDMVNSAMGKINFPESMVNSELYAKTQKYLDDAIRESVMKANKVGLNPALANEPEQRQGELHYRIINGKLQRV